MPTLHSRIIIKNVQAQPQQSNFSGTQPQQQTNFSYIPQQRPNGFVNVPVQGQNGVAPIPTQSPVPKRTAAEQEKLLPLAYSAE